eukprot:CAMPEP_0177442528 /NCGR_PEP_ID=MMETSP0369-20130122/4985_1 /TAXON_ID=447022 ORGANISM="Scrippsiella hangoei-like, Strain SHHI-4" /NCGR_SAMPLE_ID=MMETSP0369 /ASSEMBLY_ACC=CAM_ASM_000364 /LENGTH=51 /DNA_ID=CAMNT_0018914465 /DNA_START=174 /DNA_END=325 /DNA_ORIENTATION=-
MVRETATSCAISGAVARTEKNRHDSDSITLERKLRRCTADLDPPTTVFTQV